MKIEQQGFAHPAGKARPAPKKMSLDEQVNSIKEKLYEKIDVCFMKYGLRGLEKIDESIADGLAQFIAAEKGVAYTPRQAYQPVQQQFVPQRPVSRASSVNEDFMNNPAVAMAAEMDISSNDDIDTTPLGMTSHIDTSEEEAQVNTKPTLDEETTPMSEPNKPRRHFDFRNNLPQTERTFLPGEEAAVKNFVPVNDSIEVPENYQMPEPEKVAGDFGDFDMSSFN